MKGYRRKRLDPPGKCDKPELIDWDKDHVDLKWNPPANDGGAPIEEYIVEKKDKHGRWEQALVVKDGKTECTVPNLKVFFSFMVFSTTNCVYRRVKSTSSASSPGTKPVWAHRAIPPTVLLPRRASVRSITSHNFMQRVLLSVKPKIHREDLPATTVRVEQPIAFNVHIDGEPPPKAFIVVFTA